MGNIEKNTQIISVFNQKGGCSKTTVAINIASCLAEDFEKSVLVLDNDGQGNSTYVLTGKDDDQLEEENTLTIHELMVEDDILIKDCIISSKFKNIDIVPATIDHSETDLKIINKMESTRILFNKLKEIDGKYDYIIIDNSPMVLQSTQNALLCSDIILSPVEPSLFSKKGLRNLIKLIIKVNKIKDIPLKHYAFLSKVNNSRRAANTSAGKVLKLVFGDAFIDKQISQLAIYVKTFDDGETVVTTRKYGTRGHKEIKDLTTSLLEKINESEEE